MAIKKLGYLLQIQIYIIIILFQIFICTCRASDHEIIMATGSPDGLYCFIGSAISNEISKREKIKVINSNGSLENIRLLKNNEVDLAILQNDIAHYAYNGSRIFHKKFNKIRCIASLYTEKIQILIRKPLFIGKIENLKGKRISIGPHGSGTEINARAILESSGITIGEIIPFNLSISDSISKLTDGEIDCCFITAGAPLKIVTKIMESGKVYLMSLDQILIERLVENFPFLVWTEIPADTYPNQSEKIHTIGVKALLVTKNKSDKLSMRLAIMSIFDGKNQILKNIHRNDFSLSTDYSNISIPPYSVAENYVKQNRIISQKFLNLLFIILIIIILACCVYLFSSKSILLKTKLFSFLKTNELARVFIFVVLIILTGSLLLYFFEHKVNECYADPIISLWSGFVSLLQFGSKEPITTSGKISLVITYVTFGGLAVLLFSDLISSFVKNKLEVLLKGTKQMPKNLNKHFVILNWNANGEEIINQLRNEEIKEKRNILIVSATDRPDIMEKLHDLVINYDDIYVKKGDQLDEALLEEINIYNAFSIIILHDNSSRS